MNTILLVENDVKIREELKDYLTINDFEVLFASNLSEALRVCNPRKLDALVVDQNTLGEETFNYIKRVRIKKVIPAIVISDKDSITDKVIALRSGIDDYMVKPINYSEFVARVRAHTDSFNMLTKMLINKEDILEINGLTIDKKMHRVFVDDMEIDIGRREYSILEFMMDNPGIVFSKEEIYQRLWGLDSIGNISTVTVHIKKLRDCIEKESKKERFIETIWGVGYRFKV